MNFVRHISILIRKEQLIKANNKTVLSITIFAGMSFTYKRLSIGQLIHFLYWSIQMLEFLLKRLKLINLVTPCHQMF